MDFQNAYIYIRMTPSNLLQQPTNLFSQRKNFTNMGGVLFIIIITSLIAECYLQNIFKHPVALWVFLIAHPYSFFHGLIQGITPQKISHLFSANLLG